MKVEISTKRLTQYFKGELRKEYDPISGKDMWFVSCEAYGGGGRQNSPLDVLDFKVDSLKKIRTRLKSFALRNRYQIKFNKS